MKTDKNRKPFKTLAEDLKKARRRPLTPEQVEKINKLFEKDIEAEKNSSKDPAKKIAGTFEIDTEV